MEQYSVGDKVHVCDSYGYYEGEVIEAIYIDIPEYSVKVDDSNKIVNINIYKNNYFMTE